LSDFDPNNSEWRAVAENVCRALVDENPASVTPWVEILRPVEAILIEPLTRRFRDSSAPASVRVIAAGILAKFVEADPELLSELIVTADSEQFELLFEPLHHHGPAALRLLEDRLVLLASQDQPAPHDQLVRAQQERVAQVAPTNRTPARTQRRSPTR
jgi:hypothetical protein